MLSQWLRSTRYTRIPQNVSDNQLRAENEEPSVSLCFQHNDLSTLVFFVCFGLLLGWIGFAIGVNVAQDHNGLPVPVGTVPQGLLPYSRVSPKRLIQLVSIGWAREMFHYNDSFARLSLGPGGSEPIWDSLMPSKPAVYRSHNANNSNKGS